MKKIFILILSLTLSRFIDGQIPTLLKDINSGASNGIGAFTIYRFSNYGLFIAYDGSLSTQIWNTDGTTNGTTLIADFPLGQTVSSPQFVDTINGYLILFAGDSTSGSEFYSLDENLNLQLLNDMTPGTGNSFYAPWVKWRKGNNFYFVTDCEPYGTEIWKTDGTPAGTEILLDIQPGPGISNPYDFTPYHDSLLFTAYDSIHGEEIWITDGSTSGTYIVKDLSSVGSSVGHDIFNCKMNDVFYFSAKESPGISCSPNNELYRTDGTFSGTYKAKEINPSCHGSNPEDFFLFKNNIFFTALHPISGRELWKSDGSDQGTVLLKDINPTINTSNSFIKYLWQDSSKFYFLSGESYSDKEIWESDGINTNLLIDIYPGIEPGVFDCCFDFNNLHFFIGNDSVTGNEPWITDGTTSGTFLLSDINPGIDFSNVIINSNSIWKNSRYIFFMAYNPIYGHEMWRTDGTTIGTFLLKDIQPGNGSSFNRQCQVINDELFFIAEDTISGMELWKTDGTTTGTYIIKDIIPGPTGAFENSSAKFNVFRNGNYIYFTAGNITPNNVELWRTDGTDTGTTILAEINPDTIGSFPRYFGRYNNNIYFSAKSDSTGFEPYILNLNTVPGIIEIKEKQFEVFPNPTIGKFHISINSGDQNQMQVFDLNGREILSSIFNTTTEFSFPDNIPSGIYVIRVFNSKVIFTSRISLTR